MTDILWTMLGPDVSRLLSMPDLTGLVFDDTRKLWAKVTGKEPFDTGCTLSQEHAYAAICIIATRVRKTITARNPTLSATIPGTKLRIEASIPPETEGPTFTIRKPGASVFPYEAFDPDGKFATAIRGAVIRKLNILVAGPQDSGKTSFISMILAMPEFVRDRVVVIEDEEEIRITSPARVRLLTSPERSLSDLVKSSLRRGGDRLVLGEVRDGRAVQSLIRALSTGMPGSLCSVHADSASDALNALGDMLRDSRLPVPHDRIARAFGMVVFLSGKTRQLTEVVYVDGWKDGTYDVRAA